jgi:hypothetical protein
MPSHGALQGKAYLADYYVKPIGATGKGARRQLRGSISQHLRGTSSETAVRDYLRQQHAGCEVALMKLEWLEPSLTAP